MQNGCICCTLREDLLNHVTELAHEKNEDGSKKWDYLVIESTGISEPLPVAQTFVMEVAAQNLDHNHDHKHEHDNEEKSDELKDKGTDKPKDQEDTIDVDNLKEDGDVVDIDNVKEGDAVDLDNVKEGDVVDLDTKNEAKEGELPVLKDNPLLRYARLDTLVTVVDSCNFFERLAEIERVKDQPDAEGDEAEERTLADLMVDQVEFSNVIILNKADVMISNKKEKELEAVEACLKRLNPKAEVIRTNFGKVPHKKILNTNLFDMNNAQQSAGWLAELSKPEHTPETEEYGVSSLVFRSNKPFHPKRLHDILGGFGQKKDESSDTFAGVIRSKGKIWIANAFAIGFMWHTAGYQFHMEPLQNPYMACVLEFVLRVPYLGKVSSQEKIQNTIMDLYSGYEDKEVLKQAISGYLTLRMDGKWSDDFGDRYQELVLIGVDLDKPRLKEELEKALLTDEEMEAGKKDLKAWKSLEDPFFGGKCVEMYWGVKAFSSANSKKTDEDAQ